MNGARGLFRLWLAFTALCWLMAFVWAAQPVWEIAVYPPIVTLVTGSVLVWVIRGFRQ